MEGKTSEHVEMVPAEHALEHMPIEKAWFLLGSLTSQVDAKQTELQLMVGSRYHELIESADSIVSMKKISSEVLGLLKDFSTACSGILHQVPLNSGLDTDSDARNATQRRDLPTAKLFQVIQLMLHAPAEMWAALDSNSVLDAANLLLRCRASWNDISRSYVSDVDPSLAAFLRSHLTYVEQFPHRIATAATHILTHSRNSVETARALASLLILKAHGEEDSLRCLLELLLRRRGAAIIATMKKATKEGKESEVEEVLNSVVRTVQRTIVHVHSIFSPREDGDGECLLLELADSSSTSSGDHGLSEGKAKHLCTQWLSILAPKIQSYSKKLLGDVGDTNTMARIRGAMWAITHGEGQWGVLSSERKFQSPEECRSGWTQAVAFGVDLRGLIDDKRNVDMGSLASLDLWNLFFSSIFAELAEVLMKESFHSIRQRVKSRLDSVLVAITGGTSGIAFRETQDAYVHQGPKRSRLLMAHDILGAAESVVSLFLLELRGLAEDTWSLTERGDEHAADALEISFYFLCIQMAASVSHQLRVALEGIHACIKAMKQDAQLAAQGERSGSNEAIESFVDAGLTIGRIAWMLKGQKGRPLQNSLACPKSLGRKMLGRIEEHQLEAAFIIADTDGDGVVDSNEAAEALQAVSFGTSTELVLDPTMYSSFTLSEFFLFATGLLEEQKPLAYLRRCLDRVLASSLDIWAECALNSPAALLFDGYDRMAARCKIVGMTDKMWRESHGIWEDKTIELDQDEGDEMQETVCFPTVISPAMLCYVQGVASELARVLSVADVIENCSKDNLESEGATLRSVGYDNQQGMRPGGRDGGQGPSGYARSLAAARVAKDLEVVLSGLCKGSTAAATGACEAALLQMLLDALFLQRSVRVMEVMTSSVDLIVATLCDLVDPIDLQIYMPHLQAAAEGCWAACNTSLSLIFGTKSVVPSSNIVGASGSLAGTSGCSSSFMILVPKVRRFEILPLPLTVLGNGNARSRLAPGNKREGQPEDQRDDSSPHSRGMQAGRQALAGLMDQVGSVGSVLSAQNMNVQSVFGAASLFLGRNRRADDVEEKVL